jgi:uncharacterized protein
MKLEVKNLVLAPVGKTDDLIIEMFNEQIDDDILAERIKGNLHLLRIEEEVLAQFSGAVKVRVVCDRCAEEYSIEIPLKFSQEYVLHGDEVGSDQLEITRDFKIDIVEPLRQEIQTALPVKKLCKEDCAGLCAACGANLNSEKCKCKKG